MKKIKVVTVAKRNITFTAHVITSVWVFPLLDCHGQGARQEGVVETFISASFVVKVTLDPDPLPSDTDILLLVPRILCVVAHFVHHVACVDDQVVVQEEMAVILTRSNS